MDNSQFKTQNHSAFKLYYHVIFTIKYRKRCISEPMLQRLEDIFADLLQKWRCRLLEFGGEEDPVHLLVEAHPVMNLSQMIGNLKT